MGRPLKPSGYPAGSFISSFNNGASELLGYKDAHPSFYIPSPKRLREKFNYTQVDIPVWTETPDLQDFANELYTLRNREELVQVIKNRALDRGFKVSLPYGIKNYTFYVSCSHYRAPRPGCEEPDLEKDLPKTKGGKKQRQCPFSLIIKKHPIGPEGMPHLHPAFSFNPADPTDNQSLS